MSTKEFVDSKIKNGKVVVWSKSYCPYCKKAKDALFSLLPKDAVDVEELDQRSDGDEIQDYLQQLTGGRSVPRVFIGGKFIGGGDDTVRMKKSGELQAKLADVGAMAA
ncbi:glutaredoxin [Coccomyxa subellipsoidea C-169]|uniref:Glutaredoxin n=1 Tax=Coccomyxa subellipsoidea (strain C-169) TaxID=574566 RepID=I0YZS3_COCSC|nr:glutaredoxin [Coccomyxa subellipsoidea C-169]EIE23892.1 glutaredoxin [Coccomyxa subellipsoidea C-169]|eukprot:XP_005648436.1 glutaredoxin [Coccomyxa subellipsoidea C-169]